MTAEIQKNKSQANKIGLVVIGGGGFIGSGLLADLPTDTWVYSIGDKTTSADAGAHVNKIASTFTADPRRLESHSLNSIIQSVSQWKEVLVRDYQVGEWAVVILTGSSDVTLYRQQMVSALNSLFSPLACAFDLAKQIQATRLLYVSSSLVYGNIEAPNRASENSLLKPLGLYGAAKIAAEKLVEGFSYETGIPVWIVRPSNIYSAESPPISVVGKLKEQIRSGCSPSLQNISSYRDFIHLKDVCRAFWLMIKKSPVDLVQVVNLASGHTIQIAELVDLFRKSADRLGISLRPVPAELKSSPQTGSSSPAADRIALDTARLHSVLGFSSEISIESGVEELIRTVGENRCDA